MGTKDKKECEIFLSRDTIGGRLQPWVTVWESKPIRHVTQLGDRVWLSRFGSLETQLGSEDLETAKFNYGTIPETDLELIKIRSRDLWENAPRK